GGSGGGPVLGRDPSQRRRPRLVPLARRVRPASATDRARSTFRSWTHRDSARMAYDEQLASRVRTLLASRTDVSERPMFGDLTFMVAGNTFGASTETNCSRTLTPTPRTKRSQDCTPARWT